MTFDESMEDKLWWKTTFHGGLPPMEDDLRLKTTFNRRQPSIQDDIQLKTTFNLRWPLMKDNLWWQTTFVGETTFHGRWPEMENNYWWKTTFDRRQPCWWKMAFNGRRSLMIDELQHKTTFGGSTLSFWTGGFLNWSFTTKTKSCSFWNLKYQDEDVFCHFFVNKVDFTILVLFIDPVLYFFHVLVLCIVKTQP